MTSKLWHIQKLDLFKGLGEQKIKLIEKLFDMKLYCKKEIIFEPHDKNKVFIVKTGRVELYTINHEGKKVIIDVLTKGSIFGDLGTIQAEDTFVEASEDSYICFLDKNRFFKLVSEYPSVSEVLMRKLFNRLMVTEGKVSSLASDNAMQRFIKLILHLGQKNEPISNRQVVESFTHEELAQMLGITRQTVTTLINQLEKQGMLSRDKKKIYFDRRQLASLSV